MPSSSAAESFLYIWYDTKNKKYYLGKHKGTPDDSYTHSSSIMESFNKDNIPSYMRRRILAYGTDEEMCLLEHECLKSRKEKKWDRYYNVWLGDPRYVVLKGEDHPSYKHGLSGTPEYDRQKNRKWKEKNRNKAKEWWDEYYKKNRDRILKKEKKYYKKNRDRILKKSDQYYEKNRDEILKRIKEYNKNNEDKVREYKKKYYAENEEKIRKHSREYHAENKERILERQKKYRAKNKDKIKEQQRLYYQKNKEKRNEQQRILRAKKKAERLASGATLPI